MLIAAFSRILVCTSGGTDDMRFSADWVSDVKGAATAIASGCEAWPGVKGYTTPKFLLRLIVKPDG